MFVKELQTRLDDNIYSNPSGKFKSAFDQSLNLNQIIYPELLESFFHQFMRALLKEERLK